MSGFTIFLVTVISLVVYMLPTIIMAHRKMHNQWSFAVLNVLLGFTFFVWVVLLAWALQSEDTYKKDAFGVLKGK